MSNPADGAPHEELVRRLSQNDESALQDILRAFGPPVHAVLSAKYEQVIGKADLDDVLSIALFRLWSYRERYDANKGSLRVWFFRIAENALRDILKHGWHKSRRLEIHMTAAVFETTENVKDSAPLSERLDPNIEACLRRIISELPEAQRLIVMADAQCRDEVAPSRALAEQLEIPQSTVRVYRNRAIERIRSELAKSGYTQATYGANYE